MTRSLRGAWLLSIVPTVLPFLVGCREGDGPHQANQSPTNPAPGGPVQPPGIRQIMGKLAKGPNSLTPVLGKELKEAEPPWETIQGQAKEYARLAADLATFDPPKGSKESWAKLTADYAGSAADLDKAAQVKDKDATLAAHTQLANSCTSCHREHRKMGPRGGGPPGGFRGGPPPGRPVSG